MKIKANGTIIVVILLIVFFLPYYITAFVDRNHNVQSCERSNVVRVGLDKFLDSAIKARQTSSQTTSGTEEKENDLRAAKQYRKIQVALQNSSTNYAPYKGAVIVDCQEAFPEPFPFYLFK